jgi:hypothetical protein
MAVRLGTLGAVYREASSLESLNHKLGDLPEESCRNSGVEWIRKSVSQVESHQRSIRLYHGVE